MSKQETKMFWADLDMFRDLGFPQTATRIREELRKSWNADFFINWAFDHGYSIRKNQPVSYLTDEFNFDNQWSVMRDDVPYCSPNSDRVWSAPTAKEAIEKAYYAISKWNSASDRYGEMIRPFWLDTDS